MEIRIGKALDMKLMEQGSKRKYLPRTSELKARVIGCRSARRSPVVLNRGLRDRRAKRIFRDPTNSKVITLLIENAEQIPEDIDTGNYDVSLKFTKE